MYRGILRTRMVWVALVLVAATGGVGLMAAAKPARPASGSGQETRAGRVWKGPAVRIGRGTARTVVVTRRGGALQTLGIELSEGALQGLPTEDNLHGGMLGWHYMLQFPKGAPPTGFDQVMINWNPHGHPPQGIYTVPHFDFHFFLIDEARRSAIHYPHEGQGMEGVQQPPARLMAPGYMIPPGTEINGMGVHAVDTKAPEMHGQPFQATFIYGYYAKQLVFLEPMVSLAFLNSRPDITRKIPVPGAYSFAAHYPTQYRVRYDAARRVYQVMLDGLRAWRGGSAKRRGGRGR